MISFQSLHGRQQFLKKVILRNKLSFLGRNLLMEFVYDSADAAGQNGVTVTTWHACKWAMEKIAQERPDINIREYFIDTKMSGDKSALPKNYITGRGIEVQAETYITESMLKRVLKVSNN